MAIYACALGDPMARSFAHAEILLERAILLARAKAVMVYVLTRVERRKTKKKKKSKKKMAKFKDDSKETPLPRRLMYCGHFFAPSRLVIIVTDVPKVEKATCRGDFLTACNNLPSCCWSI